MSKLFINLVNNGLIKSWASFLDWLFNDEKFTGWTPNLLVRYLKRLKKMPGIGENNYEYDAIKNLSFPKRITKGKIKIVFGRHSGEAKDWVRHIRNSIAHDKARIIKEPDEPWIEFKDYNRSGDQTAYMYFPARYVFKVFETYKDIDKQK